MCGWLMAAAERASCRKSFRNFGSCARFSRKTLIATSRFRVGSNARNTVPMPPWAISSSTLKWPSFDESAIENPILVILTRCASFGCDDSRINNVGHFYPSATVILRCTPASDYNLDVSGVADNINLIRQRIGAAAVRVGRSPEDVTLIAVSKAIEPERVEEALSAGQVIFGESKVQEARAKIPLLSGRARWHMIGHLQTNKVRDAVALFDVIHSVDSANLAE